MNRFSLTTVFFVWFVQLIFAFAAHQPIMGQEVFQDTFVRQASWFDLDEKDEPSVGRSLNFSDMPVSPEYRTAWQKQDTYQRPLFPQAPRSSFGPPQFFRQESGLGIPFSNFQIGDTGSTLTAPGDFSNRLELGSDLLNAESQVDGEAIQSASKGPSSNITVEIQADYVNSGQDANSLLTVGELPDGAFFRRARLGAFGEVYDRVEYRIEFEFASVARPRFLDLWVAMTDIPIIRNVIIGQFFEPFSLERYSPNRFITFTERSLADNFAPARNMGIMLYGNVFDERVTWALGGFRANSDDYGADIAFEDNYAITGHATVLPWYEEVGEHNLKLLHLGTSLSYRIPGDREVRFRSLPSARLFEQGVGGIPAFVDTGELEDTSRFVLAGVEAALVHGPFSLQAEYISSQVSRRDGTNPFFHGGYAYASWFLTGESRSYSPTSILGRFREGIFQRTAPKRNFFLRADDGGLKGIGAVELATRWSYIDLNSQDIRGGYMYEMTYGINWYWNPYTKMMFNYVQPQLNDPTLGRSVSDFFVARMQFEF